MVAQLNGEHYRSGDNENRENDGEGASYSHAMS